MTIWTFASISRCPEPDSRVRGTGASEWCPKRFAPTAGGPIEWFIDGTAVG